MWACTYIDTYTLFENKGFFMVIGGNSVWGVEFCGEQSIESFLALSKELVLLMLGYVFP